MSQAVIDTSANFIESSLNIYVDIVFNRFLGLLSPVTLPLTFDPKS